MLKGFLKMGVGYPISLCYNVNVAQICIFIVHDKERRIGFMSVKLEKIDKNVIKLQIEVDADTFEQALERSYKKNVGKYQVQGFRKGKAPRAIIERQYGVGVFYEDAVGFVYPKAYEDAVSEHQLEPVDYPKIDIEDVGAGKNFLFSATVTIKPEVELGKYKGVEVPKTSVEVTEDQVHERIKREQESNARIQKVEDRASMDTDILTIDFEGFIDGEPFEGGKAEKYQLTLGSGQFIPGFEKQLEGKQVGEEVEVNVTFPSDYNKAELSNKPAMFKVTIHEIKEKKLPALDDEFAKEVSEYETLDEYSASIREKLEKEVEDNAKKQFENEVLETIAKNATIDIPEVMVENRVENILRDIARNLKAQGIDMQTYMKIAGLDEEQLRSEYKARAEQEVRISLVIDKISKDESVEVTSEEMDVEVEKIAKSYQKTVDELKTLLQEEQMKAIEENLIYTKTIQWLVDNAVTI